MVFSIYWVLEASSLTITLFLLTLPIVIVVCFLKKLKIYQRRLKHELLSLNAGYKLNKIPDDFMQTNVSRAAILELIQQIECCRDSQDNVDRVCNSFCDTLINEMNESVPYFDCSKPTRKRFKSFKPYWNENLEKHWNEM